MRWLYKLEYKYGRYYIHRLMMIVVVGMAAVYLLSMAAAGAGIDIIQLFSLDRSMILPPNWQLWRLITFIFIPDSNNLFMMLISLYLYYMIGTLLENTWGGFRFNLYYFIGIIGAIAATMIVGYGTNTYLKLALVLAFATLAPDTTFRLFFILPVKAKWMALAYAGFLALKLIFIFIASPTAGLMELVSLGMSLANYFLFFGKTLVDNIRDMIRIQKNRRNWRR